VANTYTPWPAQRTQSKLRLALAGPSGAGKTYTSLLWAGALGGRLCVIDAERGSSQKYAELDGMPAFDVIVLDECTPEDYIAAIEAAEAYDVLVLDSISPEWSAVLEIVDQATQASRSQNAYTVGWRVGTPRHNAFVQAMLAFPGHLIATMREKTKYILVDTGAGGQVPKKCGMEPIQRDGIEFEFDIIGELDLDNTLTIVKTRLKDLHGRTYRKPTAAVMEPIKAWLGTGRKVYTVRELIDAVKAAGGTIDTLYARMAVLTPGVAKYTQLTPSQIETLIESFTTVHANGDR
jgi:AAA domain